MNSTVPAVEQEHAARAPRALYLWSAWASALLVAFLIDAPVLTAVRPLHGSRFAELLNHSVHWLGNGKLQLPALALLSGIALAATRKLRHRVVLAGGWAVLAFAISGIASSIIKAVVGRARPWVEPPYPQTWAQHLHGDYQAFPSGDSATTFAIAVTLGGLFPVLRLPLLAVAAVVAIARVLVGVHHPSDVVAGAMLGVAAGQWVLHRARGGRATAPPWGGRGKPV